MLVQHGACLGVPLSAEACESAAERTTAIVHFPASICVPKTVATGCEHTKALPTLLVARTVVV